MDNGFQPQTYCGEREHVMRSVNHSFDAMHKHLESLRRQLINSHTLQAGDAMTNGHCKRVA